MSNPERAREFFLHHAQGAYNLALKLSGNPTEAEDISQEALIKAVKALSQFEGKSQASTWLYRIVVNTWKNRVRSQKRRGFFSFISIHGDAESERELEIPSNDPPLDDDLARKELGDQVRTALAELAPDDRSIVVLRDMEDKSYREISEILGIPEGTVKSRLSRAREFLRDAFKKQVK